MLSSSIRKLPLRRLPPSSLQLLCQNDGVASVYPQTPLHNATITAATIRYKSTRHAFDEMGETTSTPTSATESIAFPASKDGDEVEYQPVLLNSKEHAVGYLSRILNARVYEAAIETELQHAKNLSAVSRRRNIIFGWQRCCTSFAACTSVLHTN